MHIKPKFKKFPESNYKLCAWCEHNFPVKVNKYAKFSTKIYCSNECMETAGHIRRVVTKTPMDKLSVLVTKFGDLIQEKYEKAKS